MTNINNSKLQGQQNRLHAGCNSGGRSWIAKQLHFAAGHSGSDAPPRSVALFARTQPLWKGPAVAGGHLAADRVSPAELIWWLWGAIDCVLTQAHQGPSTRRRWGAGGHCESGEISKCFFLWMIPLCVEKHLSRMVCCEYWDFDKSFSNF